MQTFKRLTTSEIREKFLNFFKERGHTVVPSSSLIPLNDATLLFTNAGMVQFKDVFLGKQDLGYKEACSSQKCVRAGGKHNDLENVGFTARHHTFFEMLGNFSFGGYFKKDAIKYAWEFITKVLQIPADKLWITVYKDDQESENIWLQEIGISPQRFSKCGEKDNFWSMGDTGPCGPCTEIFYDHGPDIPGGPPGSNDADLDRYIEIWNLVFMQFNKDENGKLHPLPKPSVDTGMGLERIAAVMQGVHSNYEIDIFQNIIKNTKKIMNNIKESLGVISTTILDTGAVRSSTKIMSDISPDSFVGHLYDKSLLVIADHLRSCAFLVADGVHPSNEGRGYVLRRIMRRAIRHGAKLGVRAPFFNELVPVLATEMGDAYPELIEKADYIKKIFLQEEIQFGRTLAQGEILLYEEIDRIKKERNNAPVKRELNEYKAKSKKIIDDEKLKIPGDIVFKLYDTYGFPRDLTEDIAKEHEMEIDMQGFEQAMLTQRELARKGSQFKNTQEASLALDAINSATVFTGYDTLENNTQITEIFVDFQQAKEIKAGQEGAIILERTPFYAESGGQVGDKGKIELNNNVFIVQDTKKIKNAHVHYGKVLSGSFSVDDLVKAYVDAELRFNTIRNHSATHLLHAALRQALGGHVMQKGSVVDSLRLRFDFSSSNPLTADEINKIETIVNTKILENSEIRTDVMPIDDAKAYGAMALFGEKYESLVRVLSMSNNFSRELCGGTHAKRTGDIGLFKIISETGVAAGIRRIEAITGMASLAYLRARENLLSNIASSLKTTKENVVEKINQLNNKIKTQDKDILKLQQALASDRSKDTDANIKEIDCKDGTIIKVLVEIIPHASSQSLREAIDKYKNKLKHAVVVLASFDSRKVNIVAGVTKEDIAKGISANEVVNYVANLLGGKGGGRDDMAMGAGFAKDEQELAVELNKVAIFVESKIGVSTKGTEGEGGKKNLAGRR